MRSFLFWDQICKNSHTKYEDFVFELFNRNLLDFTAHVHCMNGLFFVAPKEGTIRMIVDARPANEHFREPPSSSYDSGSFFASLRVP